MEKDDPFPDPVVYLFILSESSLNELSHETWRKHGHRPRSPTRSEGLRTMGFGLFPKGVVYDTALILVPCSLQHDTFHRELGGQSPFSQCVS